MLSPKQVEVGLLECDAHLGVFTYGVGMIDGVAVVASTSAGSALALTMPHFEIFFPYHVDGAEPPTFIDGIANNRGDWEYPMPIPH